MSDDGMTSSKRMNAQLMRAVPISLVIPSILAAVSLDRLNSGVVLESLPTE